MPKKRLDPTIYSSLSWGHRVQISESMKRRWKTSKHLWKNNFGKKERLIMKNGYVRVYRPDHPRAHFDGYVYEHILVAENKYRRSVKPNESVHHIDGNRSNNNPLNLIILLKSEHSHHHCTTFQLGKKYGPMNKGENNNKAKLTSNDVLEIRRLAKTRKILHREIAKMFSISLSNVRGIIYRQIWKSLP